MKSYSDTPLGIHVEFNTRNGPFFGTLLFVTGCYLAKLKPSEEWLYYGAALFSIGTLVHFSEIYFLMKHYGTSMTQDFVFGTYMMGVGAAVVSLSNHKLLRIPLLSGFGKLTLGIYAIHFIFVDLFSPFDYMGLAPLWEISYVFIVLICSIISVKILAASKTFRRIVI